MTQLHCIPGIEMLENSTYQEVVIRCHLLIGHDDRAVLFRVETLEEAIDQQTIIATQELEVLIVVFHQQGVLTMLDEVTLEEDGLCFEIILFQQ